MDSLFIDHWLQQGAIVSLAPQRVLLGWGERECVSAIPKGKRAFLFTDFFLREPSPFYLFEHCLEISHEHLLQMLSEAKRGLLSAFSWSLPQRKAFSECWQFCQKGFASNEINKMVPYLAASSRKSIDAKQRCRSIHSALLFLMQHDGYIYGLWSDREGILGVSPEKLFALKQEGSVETMAVASTLSGEVGLGDFAADPKLMKEHQWVIDGIRETLAPFADVCVGDSFVRPFGTLSHLVTTIVGILKKQPSLIDLIGCMHPTPALGAYPKKAGERWLEEYDKKQRRGYFGAPVGWATAKEAEVFVAIRNVMWDRRGTKIFAGCGIVKESEEESEWRELQQKIASIRNLLAL